MDDKIKCLLIGNGEVGLSNEEVKDLKIFRY